MKNNTPSPSIENTEVKLDSQLIEPTEVTEVKEWNEEAIEAVETENDTQEKEGNNQEDTSASDTIEEDTEEQKDTEESVTEEKAEEVPEEEQIKKDREELQTLKDNLEKRPERVLSNLRKMHDTNESFRSDIVELKQTIKDKDKEIEVINRRLTKREEELDAGYDEFDRPTIELAKLHRPFLKTLQQFEKSGSSEDWKKVKLFLEDMAEEKGLISNSKYSNPNTPQKSKEKISSLFYN